MAKEIRFAAFAREITAHHIQISYRDLVPTVEKDERGNELPYRPARLMLRPVDVYSIVKPYVSARLAEQIRAVLPLAIYLVLFQITILRENVAEGWIITAGLLSVIVGLMFFLEGLKVGLMPFGETIGITLPAKAKFPIVLFIAFLLGIGVTFAEPAIGALKTAGSIVDVGQAPYLYALLNEWSEVLILVIGAGVGLATVLGTLRFFYGWSLKPLIYSTLVPAMGLTIYIMFDSELSKTLGLAWDSGAVTTGPVTVPLVLSLGVGIAAAAGKGESSLSGFGIVTLASIFPIIAVQILAIYIAQIASPEEIIAKAALTLAPVAIIAEPWFARAPFAEMIMGLRAIVPLVVFLFLVMTFILREKISKPGEIVYGITLAILGMIVFNLGLTYGLAKLGDQSGGLVPAAFTQIETVKSSPLYAVEMGLFIAGAFAWLLGFGATLAEPALNTLGMTVQNLTNGAFRKSMLMYAVSFGVGCGIAIGVFKIVFSIPIAYLLIPGYIVAVVLTALSSEEFVNVAWDSAGVTTGPITVPLILAVGLGFGNAIGAVDGFGILAMASIGPIISVLGTGIYVQWRIEMRHRAEILTADDGQIVVT
jgi:hypothetical protein